MANKRDPSRSAAARARSLSTSIYLERRYNATGIQRSASLWQHWAMDCSSHRPADLFPIAAQPLCDRPQRGIWICSSCQLESASAVLPCQSLQPSRSTFYQRYWLLHLFPTHLATSRVLAHRLECLQLTCRQSGLSPVWR